MRRNTRPSSEHLRVYSTTWILSVQVGHRFLALFQRPIGHRRVSISTIRSFDGNRKLARRMGARELDNASRRRFAVPPRLLCDNSLPMIRLLKTVAIESLFRRHR